VDDTYGDFDAGGDGADGFAAPAAGQDALQHLDGDAALEQVVEDDQSLQEVAAEAVDLLDGQHVAVADVGQRVQQRGPVVGVQLAADLLLEDLQADRVQGVVLPLGVLLVGADPDQADERHDDRLPFIKRAAHGR
jgi:hypothetical protein